MWALNRKVHPALHFYTVPSSFIILWPRCAKGCLEKTPFSDFVGGAKSCKRTDRNEWGSQNVEERCARGNTAAVDPNELSLFGGGLIAGSGRNQLHIDFSTSRKLCVHLDPMTPSRGQAFGERIPHRCLIGSSPSLSLLVFGEGDA